MNRLNTFLRHSPFLTLVAPVVVWFLLIGVWQLVLLLFDIPKIVIPGPWDVAEAVYEQRVELFRAMMQTSLAAMTGLLCSVILGVVIACVFAQSRLIRTFFYPYAILLQTVPIIAVAPIVIMAVGRGFSGIVLIAALISLFPVIANTTTGLLRIDRGLVELFQLHSASRWQTLIKLRLPHSIPYIVAGIRISAGAAVVGAIVGEFFVGSSLSGLGVLIESRSRNILLAELYAAVLASATLGVIVFAMVTVAGDWVLKKHLGQAESIN